MNMKLVEKSTSTRSPLTRGALLPNGATIIDYVCISKSSDSPGKFGRLLAVHMESPDPFVVWYFRVNRSLEIETRQGHYYDQLEPALADLKST